jgi:hypothetical protein
MRVLINLTPLLGQLIKDTATHMQLSNGSVEGDQIRKTEWSKQRSDVDVWRRTNASGRVVNTLAWCIATGTTGAATAGKLGCPDAPSVFANASGWMWQSLEAGVVGAFPQCPVGLQQPLREFANMKYWEHDTHPPHTRVTTSSKAKPIFGSILNTITPLPKSERSPLAKTRTTRLGYAVH